MGAGAGWICPRVSFLGRSVRKLSEVEEPRKKEKKENPIAWSPGDLRYNKVRPQMLIGTKLNLPPAPSSDFSQGFLVPACWTCGHESIFTVSIECR